MKSVEHNVSSEEITKATEMVRAIVQGEMDELMAENKRLEEQLETEQRWRRENYEGMVFWKTQMETQEGHWDELDSVLECYVTGGFDEEGQFFMEVERVLKEARGSNPASGPDA